MPFISKAALLAKINTLLASAKAGKILASEHREVDIDFLDSVGATEYTDDNAITNAKLADMIANTIKSNATASTADPSDLVMGLNTILLRAGANITAFPLSTLEVLGRGLGNIQGLPMLDIEVAGQSAFKSIVNGREVWLGGTIYRNFGTVSIPISSDLTIFSGASFRSVTAYHPNDPTNYIIPSNSLRVGNKFIIKYTSDVTIGATTLNVMYGGATLLSTLAVAGGPSHSCIEITCTAVSSTVGEFKVSRLQNAVLEDTVTIGSLNTVDANFFDVKFVTDGTSTVDIFESEITFLP